MKEGGVKAEMLGLNRSGSSCKGGTDEAHGKGKELKGMELLEEGTKGKTDSWKTISLDTKTT